jgi:hypothetical protein
MKLAPGCSKRAEMDLNQQHFAFLAASKHAGHRTLKALMSWHLLLPLCLFFYKLLIAGQRSSSIFVGKQNYFLAAAAGSVQKKTTQSLFIAFLPRVTLSGASDNHITDSWGPGAKYRQTDNLRRSSPAGTGVSSCILVYGLHLSNHAKVKKWPTICQLHLPHCRLSREHVGIRRSGRRRRGRVIQWIDGRSEASCKTICEIQLVGRKEAIIKSRVHLIKKKIAV